MLRAFFVSVLVGLAGCDDPAPRPAPEADRTPAGPAAPEAPAPTATETAPALEGLDGLAAAPTEDELAPRAGLSEARPDAGACVLASETRAVLEGAGPVALAAGADGALIVAGYTSDEAGEALAVVRVRPDGPPALYTRIPLAGRALGRSAPPALDAGSAGLLVAATDAAGHVLVADLDLSLGAAAGRFFAELEDAHADPRFPPLVLRAAGGVRVVAWTDGRSTPMRVRLSRFGPTGERLGTDTISPDGGGAAPVLGLGERTPGIYLVEARVAMSAVHRVALDEGGAPGTPEVARPLLRGAELPSIAVARAASGTRTHLAYAAVGNLATRAIGLVQTTGTDAPAPLVPGLGYGGPITVRAAPLEGAVVFAMEAPSEAAPSAPHEVRVRLARDDGTLGPALVLSGHRAPDVVRLGELVALGTDGARVTFLRCLE
jgi:hypothetical protein